MQELTEKMIEATKKLQEVDCSVEPTDAEMDAYNALREAAYDLTSCCSHIMEG